MSNLTVQQYQGLDIVFDDFEPLLTQAQMATLFGVSRDAVSVAIQRAIKSGALDENSVTYNLSVTATDGKKYQVKHYNLDVVLLVGFRVNHTPQVVAFRQWVGNLARQAIRFEMENSARLEEYNQQLRHAVQEERMTRLQAERQADALYDDYNNFLARLRHQTLIDNIE